MNRSSHLIIWLIGLLGCAIPIVMIFAAHLVPDSGPATGNTVMDVARQSYPNILFMVIAVSGIAIAEAIMLFFRMVEVGEARATPALWLLTMVLLIVFSSISYARVLGPDFNPARVSDQQLLLACAGAFVAVIAALALRLSVIKLEGVARQHVHDNAVMSTLEEVRENQDDQLDMYDFTSFPAPAQGKAEDEPKAETDMIEPPKPREPVKQIEPSRATEFVKPADPPKVPDIVKARRAAKAAEAAEAEKAAEAEQVTEPAKTAAAQKEKPSEPAEEAEDKKMAEPVADEKKETEKPSTASTRAKSNPRLTRRSAGTRIKKPRSKDAT